MKELKIVFIIFLLVFMSSLASAVSNPKPVITVIFDEPVVVSTIQTELTDLAGNPFDLIKLSGSSDNTTFEYQPVDLLDEGSYVFTITADDIYGNKGVPQRQVFTVEITEFNISIKRPSFGVSGIVPFDIEIETSRYGVCKYSFTDIDYVGMLGLFETEDNIIHKVDGFSETGDFYVKCNDHYDKIYSQKFFLVYDTTAPKINYLHVDDVFQLTKGELLTTMQIYLSEEAICKYITNDDKKEYDQMNFLSGLDENEVESYKNSHMQNLSGEEIVDYQTNYVYVICKDKADIFSLKTQEDFIVNTNESPIITINSPKPPHYTSNSTILFDVTTNKNADCRYGPERLEDYNAYPYSMSGSENIHISTKTFSQGTYTYYIKCRFANEGDQPPVSTIFTIDKTPPTMVYVNDTNPDLKSNSDYTYHTNKLYGKWFAYDNETDVVEYLYQIYVDNSYSDDVIIATGTTSNGEEWVTGLSLNESKRYYFKVSARNIVGLWSSNKTSDGITVDTSLRPASCYDGIKNNDETDRDCGGGCPACMDGENCIISADCVSGVCINGVCAEASCDDNTKNGDETDVDCGSSCPKCINNKFCKNDTDCLSGSCIEGVCADFDFCSDEIKNSDETDVDCGGSCSGCSIGKICEINNDCISQYCEDGFCKLPACDDGAMNGDETDVDCGGSCSGCDIGSKCEIDTDCISKVCEYNLCAESKDKDNDGLPNDWEIEYGLDPENYDTDNNGISDADEDPDNDGLTNLEEYNYGTDPLKYDTDEDGYSDKEEIEAGTDPNDPDSKPKSRILFYLLLIIVFVLAGVGAYYGYKRYNEYFIENEVKKTKILPEDRKKKYGAVNLPKQTPAIKKVMKKEDSLEVKNILKKRRKEKENRKKRIFDEFLPKIKKKSQEEIKKEAEFKKMIGKYVELSEITDDRFDILKGMPVSKLDGLFKGKNKREVKEMIEKLSEDNLNIKEKRVLGEKAGYKEDVFERLSKVLPYKKKKG